MILDKLKLDTKFTKRSLALEMGVDRKTIERDLEVLKKEKKIVFVGNKKTGTWKLIE